MGNGKIYAFTVQHEDYAGLIKIGYTERDDVTTRIQEQFPTLLTDKTVYEIVFEAEAVTETGGKLRDHTLHRLLKAYRVDGHKEFFRCTVEDVKAAYAAAYKGLTHLVPSRTEAFTMREEQEDAVERTSAYMTRAEFDEALPSKFLWNAKMRFGKTFATYKLAQRMGFTRVLVITFKPAVKESWRSDLETHIDFVGWRFVDIKGGDVGSIKDGGPTVVFGSFQDLLGRDEHGQIKEKNELLHDVAWDLIVLDEYHYGAWNDRSQRLFSDNEHNTDLAEEYASEEFTAEKDELPFQFKHMLLLSGTPFKALASGEFSQAQIFNWTYVDEQQRKSAWDDTTRGPNPYRMMPEMRIYTYKVPESVVVRAGLGVKDGFALNKFFRTNEDGRFEHEASVQQWLMLLTGASLPSADEAIQLSMRKAAPYSGEGLMSALAHTLWFLPSVAATKALAELMRRTNLDGSPIYPVFANKYIIQVAAGPEAGIGAEALYRVKRRIADAIDHGKGSITLTCGKLTTGVTVREWSGVLMLRDLQSPETYFQTAFRAQTPWVDQVGTSQERILKPVCYVLDFDTNRVLKHVKTYSVNAAEGRDVGTTESLREFLNFMPVIATERGTLDPVPEQYVLNALAGLAKSKTISRQWESGKILQPWDSLEHALLNDPELVRIIESIIQPQQGSQRQGARDDVKKIGEGNAAVTALKRKKQKGERVTAAGQQEAQERQQEAQEEQQERIKEKLGGLIKRVPTFMCLTDARERTVTDVINAMDETSFQRVSGISKLDFARLCDAGLFNHRNIGLAIDSFKKFEDGSLDYLGLLQERGIEIEARVSIV